MLSVKCEGNPYEIGRQHGSAAADQVKGSIAFYDGFFRKQTKMEWPEVQQEARKFLPFLESHWSEYVDEMKGLAAGAEIGYGLLNDGCTAFSWKTDNASFIAQNWDWENTQSKNIIRVHIQQSGKPNIAMMTEAGIIGKIGLNSAGVGVTLNAIRAKGADPARLPTHLALRTVLNSNSQQEARSIILKTGVAAACHITIADYASGGVGLECTAADIVELNMDNGICTHSNHLLTPHAIKDLFLLPDSPDRLVRVQELLKSTGSDPDMTNLRNILKDEKNYPVSICRSPDSKGSLQTLFSIVMDLKKKTAMVKMGKPVADGEEFELSA